LPPVVGRIERGDSVTVFLKPDMTQSERTVAEVEGWTLGVAGHLRGVARSNTTIVDGKNHA
jgi:hypothetical protein